MKIHIIGGPGSGKTYCASHLSRRFHINHYDLDDVFWDRTNKQYGVRASEEIRNHKVQEILTGDSWIVEGVYYQWLSPVFDSADLIVVLNTPVRVRQKRILRRFLKRKFGLESSKNESFSGFIELVRWNHNFDQDNLVRIKRFLSKYASKTYTCVGLSEIKAIAALK